MEELHQQGGVPRGWKFSVPDGNPAAGRDLFIKLECFQCHAIQGESLPQMTSSNAGIGPDLTGMGSLHPAEYLAESILNPNAVVITGPGYTDAAGLSIMPNYGETLTVAEWIDLVAYLKGLAGGHPPGHGDPHQAGGGDQNILFEQVVGHYRVRVVYHAAPANVHGPGSPSVGGPNQDHLMAFITDTTTGEPVPYLPVTLTIPSPKQAARTIKLIPTMGDNGFHYGADLRLPRQPTGVTLSIGASSMQVMPSAAERFSRPHEVTINWTPSLPATPIRERPLPHRHDTPGPAKGP
jgi:mono/diheme cytochrome c family protein